MQVGDEVRSKNTGEVGIIIERFGGYVVEGEDYLGTKWSTTTFNSLTKLRRAWTPIKPPAESDDLPF